MPKRHASTKIPVLLDTEVYVHCGLSFENAELKQLIEYVKDGEIELLITDVINREVRARLRKKADEISGKCRSLASELSRMKKSSMLSGGQTLKALLGQNFQDALSETFDHFLRAAKAREIPIPEDTVRTILDDYFAVLAPFGEREKRKEFPDAISICAAKEFGLHEKRKVVFVSRDNDIKAACERFDCLQYAESIDNVMVEITERRKLDRRIALGVKQFLAKPPEGLKHDIVESIQSLGVYWAGWGNGDVLSVYDFEIEKLENGRLLRMSGQKAFAAADAVVHFVAEVSRDASSRPDEAIFGDRIDETLLRYTKLRVDVELTLDSARNISEWRVNQVNWGEDLEVA
jgi:PIN domain